MNAPEPLCRLAEELLTFPPGPLAHQVRVIALPAGQHRVFRRLVEGWSDDFFWLTLPRLRRGVLCRRLLRQEAEGFPPPDGVFVSAPRLLLPEDGSELCYAMEYYFRFALPPSLFCILTDTPGLEVALAGAWERYAARGAPPIGLRTLQWNQQTGHRCP